MMRLSSTVIPIPLFFPLLGQHCGAYTRPSRPMPSQCNITLFADMVRIARVELAISRFQAGRVTFNTSFCYGGAGFYRAAPIRRRELSSVFPVSLTRLSYSLRPPIVGGNLYGPIGLSTCRTTSSKPKPTVYGPLPPSRM